MKVGLVIKHYIKTNQSINILPFTPFQFTRGRNFAKLRSLTLQTGKINFKTYQKTARSQTDDIQFWPFDDSHLWLNSYCKLTYRGCHTLWSYHYPSVSRFSITYSSVPLLFFLLAYTSPVHIMPEITSILFM